jgi:hypothetical protein
MAAFVDGPIAREAFAQVGVQANFVPAGATTAEGNRVERCL